MLRKGPASERGCKAALSIASAKSPDVISSLRIRGTDVPRVYIRVQSGQSYRAATRSENSSHRVKQGELVSSAGQGRAPSRRGYLKVITYNSDY